MSKKCARVQKMFQWNRKCLYNILDKLKIVKALCGQIMVLNCRLWHVTFYDLFWPSIIFCGRVCVASLVWRFYGRSWQNVEFIGLVSSFLAVIDPNRLRDTFIHHK